MGCSRKGCSLRGAQPCAEDIVCGYPRAILRGYLRRCSRRRSEVFVGFASTATSAVWAKVAFEAPPRGPPRWGCPVRWERREISEREHEDPTLANHVRVVGIYFYPDTSNMNVLRSERTVLISRGSVRWG